ncbi:unnamed protein product, partial [Brenthis ino]
MFITIVMLSKLPPKPKYLGWGESLLSLPRRWLSTQVYGADDEDLQFAQVAKLPVPELQATLDSYLDFASVIVNQQQLEKTQDIVKKFAEELGPKMQNILLERQKEMTNWSIDAANNDENLFEMTLKVLNSVCVCMQETLNNKQNSIFNDDTNLLREEDNDSYVSNIDLYLKIYNRTCINLQHELFSKLNETSNSARDNEVKSSSRKQFQMPKTMKEKMRRTLFDIFITGQNTHKYRMQSLDLYKNKITPKNEKEHDIIIIITLHPNTTKGLTKHAQIISEYQFNDNFQSPIDIDVISMKTFQRNDKSHMFDNIKKCYLYSMFKFLMDCKRNNTVKVFKFLEVNETIKIYIDIIAYQNFDIYVNKCCNNESVCKAQVFSDNNKSVEMETITASQQKENLQENYRNIISNIKMLVNQYNKKINLGKKTDYSEILSTNKEVFTHQNDDSSTRSIKERLLPKFPLKTGNIAELASRNIPVIHGHEKNLTTSPFIGNNLSSTSSYTNSLESFYTTPNFSQIISFKIISPRSCNKLFFSNLTVLPKGITTDGMNSKILMHLRNVESVQIDDIKNISNVHSTKTTTTELCYDNYLGLRKHSKYFQSQSSTEAFRRNNEITFRNDTHAKIYSSNMALQTTLLNTKLQTLREDSNHSKVTIRIPTKPRARTNNIITTIKANSIVNYFTQDKPMPTSFEQNYENDNIVIETVTLFPTKLEVSSSLSTNHNHTTQFDDDKYKVNKVLFPNAKKENLHILNSSKSPSATINGSWIHKNSSLDAYEPHLIKIGNPKVFMNSTLVYSANKDIFLDNYSKEHHYKHTLNNVKSNSLRRVFQNNPQNIIMTHNSHGLIKENQTFELNSTEYNTSKNLIDMTTVNKEFDTKEKRTTAFIKNTNGKSTSDKTPNEYNTVETRSFIDENVTLKINLRIIDPIAVKEITSPQYRSTNQGKNTTSDKMKHFVTAKHKLTATSQKDNSKMVILTNSITLNQLFEDNNYLVPSTQEIDDYNILFITARPIKNKNTYMKTITKGSKYVTADTHRAIEKPSETTGVTVKRKSNNPIYDYLAHLKNIVNDTENKHNPQGNNIIATESFISQIPRKKLQDVSIERSPKSTSKHNSLTEMKTINLTKRIKENIFPNRFTLKSYKYTTNYTISIKNNKPSVISTPLQNKTTHPCHIDSRRDKHNMLNNTNQSLQDFTKENDSSTIIALNQYKAGYNNKSTNYSPTESLKNAHFLLKLKQENTSINNDRTKIERFNSEEFKVRDGKSKNNKSNYENRSQSEYTTKNLHIITTYASSFRKNTTRINYGYKTTNETFNKNNTVNLSKFLTTLYIKQEKNLPISNKIISELRTKVVKNTKSIQPSFTSPSLTSNFDQRRYGTSNILFPHTNLTTKIMPLQIMPVSDDLEQNIIKYTNHNLNKSKMVNLFHTLRSTKVQKDETIPETYGKTTVIYLKTNNQVISTTKLLADKNMYKINETSNSLPLSVEPLTESLKPKKDELDHSNFDMIIQSHENKKNVLQLSSIYNLKSSTDSDINEEKYKTIKQYTTTLTSVLRESKDNFNNNDNTEINSTRKKLMTTPLETFLTFKDILKSDFRSNNSSINTLPISRTKLLADQKVPLKIKINKILFPETSLKDEIQTTTSILNHFNDNMTSSTQGNKKKLIQSSPTYNVQFTIDNMINNINSLVYDALIGNSSRQTDFPFKESLITASNKQNPFLSKNKAKFNQSHDKISNSNLILLKSNSNMIKIHMNTTVNLYSFIIGKTILSNKNMTIKYIKNNNSTVKNSIKKESPCHVSSVKNNIKKILETTISPSQYLGQIENHSTEIQDNKRTYPSTKSANITDNPSEGNITNFMWHASFNQTSFKSEIKNKSLLTKKNKEVNEYKNKESNYIFFQINNNKDKSTDEGLSTIKILKDNRQQHEKIKLTSFSELTSAPKKEAIIKFLKSEKIEAPSTLLSKNIKAHRRQLPTSAIPLSLVHIKKILHNNISRNNQKNMKSSIPPTLKLLREEDNFTKNNKTSNDRGQFVEDTPFKYFRKSLYNSTKKLKSINNKVNPSKDTFEIHALNGTTKLMPLTITNKNIYRSTPFSNNQVTNMGTTKYITYSKFNENHATEANLKKNSINVTHSLFNENNALSTVAENISIVSLNTYTKSKYTRKDTSQSQAYVLRYTTILILTPNLKGTTNKNSSESRNPIRRSMIKSMKQKAKDKDITELSVITKNNIFENQLQQKVATTNNMLKSSKFAIVEINAITTNMLPVTETIRNYTSRIKVYTSSIEKNPTKNGYNLKNTNNFDSLITFVDKLKDANNIKIDYFRSDLHHAQTRNQPIRRTNKINDNRSTIPFQRYTHYVKPTYKTIFATLAANNIINPGLNKTYRKNNISISSTINKTNTGALHKNKTTTYNNINTELPKTNKIINELATIKSSIKYGPPMEFSHFELRRTETPRSILSVPYDSSMTNILHSQPLAVSDDSKLNIFKFGNHVWNNNKDDVFSTRVQKNDQKDKTIRILNRNTTDIYFETSSNQTTLTTKSTTSNKLYFLKEKNNKVKQKELVQRTKSYFNINNTKLTRESRKDIFQYPPTYISKCTIDSVINEKKYGINNKKNFTYVLREIKNNFNKHTETNNTTIKQTTAPMTLLITKNNLFNLQHTHTTDQNVSTTNNMTRNNKIQSTTIRYTRRTRPSLKSTISNVTQKRLHEIKKLLKNKNPEYTINISSITNKTSTRQLHSEEVVYTTDRSVSNTALFTTYLPKTIKTLNNVSKYDISKTAPQKAYTTKNPEYYKNFSLKFKLENYDEAKILLHNFSHLERTDNYVTALSPLILSNASKHYSDKVLKNSFSTLKKYSKYIPTITYTYSQNISSKSYKESDSITKNNKLITISTNAMQLEQTYTTKKETKNRVTQSTEKMYKKSRKIKYNTYKPTEEDLYIFTLKPQYLGKYKFTHRKTNISKLSVPFGHLEKNKIILKPNKQHVSTTLSEISTLNDQISKHNIEAKHKSIYSFARKENLLDPFGKTNLYPIKNLPSHTQRKVMKRIRLSKQNKEILAMDTNDFFSNRRNSDTKFSRSRNYRTLPPVTVLPKEYVIRPLFEEQRFRPKPIIIDNDNDFYRKDFDNHHRSNALSLREKVNHIKDSIQVPLPVEEEVTIERPVYSTNKNPKFLRDRIDSIRDYLYNVDYIKSTQSPKNVLVKPVEMQNEDPLYYFRRSGWYNYESTAKVSSIKGKPTKRKRRTIFFLSPTVTDWWLDDMYLKIRLPVPINSNPGMVFPRRQFAKIDEVADLAALYIDDLLDYKEMLDRGELPQERATSREKGQPLCMEQFYRLLGVCRIPEVGKDRLELPSRPSDPAECEELIIVACRNYFYPIPVKAADRGRLTPGEMQAQLLHAMVDAAGAPPAPKVGLLTSMNRDQWAKAREQLIKDENNRTNLELISRALCIMCVDEAGGDRRELDADTNAMLRAMHGGGTRFHTANRWFDKTVQLIISSDGTIGMCYEHSPAEGVAAIRLAERALARAEVSDRPAPPPVLLPAPQPMKWNLTTELQRTIEHAARDIDRSISDLDLKVYTYRGYGREFMKSCRTSPDVYIQLALQYAYFKLYGYLVSTYESASLRRFRNGRVDNIRSAHNAARAWAAAMCTADTPPHDDDGQKKVSFNLYGEQKKLELFEEAARKQTAVMEANILGRGIDNHLLGLREAAREALGDLPDMFKDPTYHRMIEFKLSTSQVTTTTDGTFMGYGAVVPDGYGCSYNPKKDCVIFCISSFISSSVTNTEAFRQSLEEALDSMKLMFQNKKVES